MPDKAFCLKAAGFSWDKIRLDLLDLTSQSNSFRNLDAKILLLCYRMCRAVGRKKIEMYIVSLRFDFIF